MITPTLTGEMVYYVVGYSVRSMLNAALTASWEKGLGQVAEGEIGEEDYMKKLTDFITQNTQKVKGVYNRQQLMQCFQYASQYYKKGSYGGIRKEKAKTKKK